MSNYDFTSLSSHDFEILVRDLLQKEMNITLECFKPGSDGGIDLRYSSALESNIIVQCKHYAGSGYKMLYSKLKNEELKKVKKINPPRYILATSVGLTPGNKDDLIELLKPFCLSSSDIYGRDDLNNLIGKFPEIEKRNFKLWLTSQVVMEKILHSAIFNQTDFELESINKRIKYYVPNESFFQARNIVDEFNYCIIAGIPGIGKTTLAEILLIFYLSQGYNPIKVFSDISEAFSVYNSAEKQVFYYDDFLGQTSLEYKLNKNEEQKIIRFIESVNNSKNTKLILTTREYILNQAKATYEKLENSVIDTHKCVLDISSYTMSNRAKIFFNHIYFSDINQKYKNAILDNKNYMKIIEHTNFNPRIIEWMTGHSENIDNEEYISELIANLDNPIRIWQHAFDNQILNISRYLLIVLASLPNEVFLEDLEIALKAFYEYQLNGIYITPRDFNKALKELEGDFIKINRAQSSSIVQFHNPSIRDFLEAYLAANDSEVKHIFESATFFDQLLELCKGRVKEAFLSKNQKSISKNLDIFLEAAKRNFESESCRLTKGEFASKQKETILLEERLLFVVDIVETFKSERALIIMNWMVAHLIEELRASRGHKSSLIELLICIQTKDIDYGTLQEELISLVKLFLTKNLTCLKDYEYFLVFRKTFPERISLQDIEQARTQFLDFYNDDINYVIKSCTNLNKLDSYILSLKIVADAFNINIQEQLVKLNNRAGRLYDFKVDAEDELFYESLEEDEEIWLEEDVDSLFDILRD